MTTTNVIEQLRDLGKVCAADGLIDRTLPGSIGMTELTQPVANCLLRGFEKGAFVEPAFAELQAILRASPFYLTDEKSVVVCGASAISLVDGVVKWLFPKGVNLMVAQSDPCGRLADAFESVGKADEISQSEFVAISGLSKGEVSKLANKKGVRMTAANAKLYKGAAKTAKRSIGALTRDESDAEVEKKFQRAGT